MNRPQPRSSLVFAFGYALFACFSPHLGAQQDWKELFEIKGHFNRGHSGMFTDGAGDVDADGTPDILMGSWGASPNGLKRAGASAVYSGIDGHLIWEWYGEQPQDQMGRGACRVDDVDGDGHADVAVGAWGASGNGLSGNGVVYVFSGLDGHAIHTIWGPVKESLFGRFMRDAGDVDNDGIVDFIVGAYKASNPGGATEAGAAFVISGATGAFLFSIFGENSYDGFGRSVAGAGDVNGDGYDDFIVGAWWTDYSAIDAGSAYLFSGIDGTLIHRWDGSHIRSGMGRGVSDAGDVNGDGVPDLIVGEYLNRAAGIWHAGVTWVFSGADYSVLHKFHGEDVGETLGWFVDGPGDVDGDGYADIIGCAYQASPFNLHAAGRTYIWSGLDGHEIMRFLGSQAEGSLGRSASGVGDIDGDGLADVVVGASNMHHDGLDSAGSAFVYASNQSLDSDSDGLSDYIENVRGSVTGDIDSDDDGLLDGEEATNWTSDPVVFDTDADGIGDGVERGVSTVSAGTDPLVFIPDADPTTTTLAFYKDSDQGGANDGTEDFNFNGRIDLGELDPNDANDDLSTLVVSALIPGQWATLDASNCLAGSQVYFLWSGLGPGPTYLPGKGLSISLSTPIHIASVMTADASGNATFSRTLESNIASGTKLWFQLGEISLNRGFRLSYGVESVVQ